MVVDVDFVFFGDFDVAVDFLVVAKVVVVGNNHN